GEQGLNLRGKCKPPSPFDKEEGLHPAAVAGTEHTSPMRVPDREGKHPIEALHATLTILLISMKNNLGVGHGAEMVTAGNQIGDQFTIIVDLSVVGKPHRVVLVRHRPVSRRRKVENRQ